MKILKRLSNAVLLFPIITLIAPAYAGEVNVYSYRKPNLIQPMFAEFGKQTGIKVNVVHAKKGMLERLKNEGHNSPADVVLTTDIGRLSDIRNAGLTQAVISIKLSKNIPAHARAADNHWFGLTERARIIVAAKNRIKFGEITRYEDLAAPRFKGRLCTRSGKHPYMVALSAAMIEHLGITAAEKWLTGVKANLARKPQGNDRAQVKAIKEGVCDIAVINHYYMYKMLQQDDQRSWAEAVDIIFPNQKDRGTHMNISGMAMTRYAPNRDNALKLMNFLSADQAQKMYTQINGEYPIKIDVEPAAHLKAWGKFKRDTVALDRVAAHRSEAIKMADRVGYND